MSRGPSELARAARRLAQRPQAWRDAVAHDPRRRRFSEIHRDEHLSAWVICWAPENDTGFHDHGISSGGVAVVSGLLVEERLLEDGTVGRALYGAGEEFAFGPSVVHRVRRAGPAPAVSLHLYSPPLAHMGAWRREADGRWTRETIGAEEELRA
jgi:predicted metal-dependent enzyme (double-stranded beta helix superfamily)